MPFHANESDVMTDHSVLIVDDDDVFRTVLAHRLGREYDVQVASNGQEALDLVDLHLPDLIVSDIMMPDMDGFMLQEALQQRFETSVVPFIFLSIRSDWITRTEGRRTGVDDYLTKPVDMDVLISRVQRLLARSASFREHLHARLSKDFSNRLMPDGLPSADGYRFLVNSERKEDGGGDVFDWMEGEPGVYYLTVGDVMGKGLQAKFYAFTYWACVRSAIRTVVKSASSPAEILTHVNTVLVKDATLADTFASLLLMKWEPKKDRITYVNAGHCRPIMTNGESARVAAYSDLIAGLDPAAKYRDTTLTLSPGTAVVAYTDGLIERKMPSGELLGEEGLVRMCSEVVSEEDPTAALIERVRLVGADESFTDDVLVAWLEHRTLPE